MPVNVPLSRNRRGWQRPVLGLVLGMAAIMAPATPARSEYLPQPEEIALPGERTLLTATLSRLVADPGAEPGKALTALDGVLARLGEPTKLRGFIQFARADLLERLDRELEAREAIEESIRLLPGYSGPLHRGAMLYAYSDHGGRAADYLIRASHIDPDLVRQLDDYEINNLLTRLRYDQRRVAQLSERLLEIGWLGDSLESRSQLAVGAITGRVAANDLPAAKRFIPKLLLPSHSRLLLIQNKYQGLWPDIESWAGPKLEKQWPIYLAESREKWRATNDPAQAKAYADALSDAGHDATLIREMLPLFSKRLDPEKDYDLMLVALSLSAALARAGRWDDIEALFKAASEVWPLGSEANALNIAIGRARYLFFRGASKDGLVLLDAAIADTKQWGDEVNADALGSMHHYRACMLHKLGRRNEAMVSMANAADVTGSVSMAQLHLCMGNQDTARATLLRGLESEEERDDVLSYLQKSNQGPMQSEYGRMMHARTEALRTDPKLLVEAAKHGRILPFTLSEGAPPELSAPKPL